MKTIGIEIAGDTYYLFYNLTAMYEIEDKYGSDALEKAAQGTREASETAIGIFTIMATQGELARRAYGYPDRKIPGHIPMECITPKNVLDIKTAIYAAVVAGTERDVPSLEDTDLILLELEKKREVPDGCHAI